MITPQIKRRTLRWAFSTTLAMLAFVALLLPIVTPGLNPGLVGVQPFHGHVTVNGVVEAHSHDLDSTENDGLVFTSDNSGAAAGGLTIMTPPAERTTPTGTTTRQLVLVGPAFDQWTPDSPVTPPRLSA